MPSFWCYSSAHHEIYSWEIQQRVWTWIKWTNMVNCFCIWTKSFFFKIVLYCGFFCCQSNGAYICLKSTRTTHQWQHVHHDTVQCVILNSLYLCCDKPLKHNQCDTKSQECINIKSQTYIWTWRKAHTHTHTHARKHTRDTQFIMSVMRCEYNSLMIIICTVTLQRLKIGKWVTAVKPRDSLTGSNMVYILCVCMCACVWKMKIEWQYICIFCKGILQSLHISWGNLWVIFTFFSSMYTWNPLSLQCFMHEKKTCELSVWTPRRCQVKYLQMASFIHSKTQPYGLHMH